MKVTLVLAVLVGLALADPVPEFAPTYGWIKRVGIPEAERIRKLEESNYPTRIVGGQAAWNGQFPHQAGLISDISGSAGNGVCGASLVSGNRLVTAAHCWSDGQSQAWRFTVVLGSVTIFSGGTRVATSDVIMHSNWQPAWARNDIAIIRLSSNVGTSNTIRPIALPSGSQLNELFVGETGTASGFGQTADGANISNNQILSWTDLRIITNAECSQTFPLLIAASNICVSTDQGRSTCRGDSGGPLTVNRNNAPLLVGVTSFGHTDGCQARRPAAFARVSYFIDFIRNNL